MEVKKLTKDAKKVYCCEIAAFRSRESWEPLGQSTIQRWFAGKGLKLERANDVWQDHFPGLSSVLLPICPCLPVHLVTPSRNGTPYSMHDHACNNLILFHYFFLQKRLFLDWSYHPFHCFLLKDFFACFHYPTLFGESISFSLFVYMCVLPFFCPVINLH